MSGRPMLEIELLRAGCDGALVLCNALASMELETHLPPEVAVAIHDHLEILGPLLEGALSVSSARQIAEELVRRTALEGQSSGAN